MLLKTVYMATFLVTCVAAWFILTSAVLYATWIAITVICINVVLVGRALFIKCVTAESGPVLKVFDMMVTATFIGIMFVVWVYAIAVKGYLSPADVVFTIDSILIAWQIIMVLLAIMIVTILVIRYIKRNEEID